MANPLYRTIAENLREQIESGILKPGSQLPTETVLRKRYGASRNTIRDAIRWLATLGLVETKPGQGTFVVKKMDPFVTTLVADPRTGDSETYKSEASEQNRKPDLSEVQVEIQLASANPKIAAWLKLPEGSQLISRYQKRFIDDTPWSMQTSFYPRDLGVEGADRLSDPADIEEGVVKYLAKTLGRQQVAYSDLITVRAPNATEANFFNLPQDGRISVYEIFRTAFDQAGQPVRVTVTVYPTDRNQFMVTVGEVPGRKGQPRAEDRDA